MPWPMTLVAVVVLPPRVPRSVTVKAGSALAWLKTEIEIMNAAAKVARNRVNGPRGQSEVAFIVIFPA